MRKSLNLHLLAKLISYRAQPIRWALLFLLSAGLTIGYNAKRVRAESPSNAPASLVTTLEQIDAAANNQDAKAVLQFYSDRFSSADGLNRRDLSKAMSKFWQQFQSVKYRTELNSWESKGSSIIAETTTYITATQRLDDRRLNLEATLKSRQRYEGNKIIEQEILSEQSKLSSGDAPPTLQVNMPETIRFGEKFSFDVIVEEPLGDDLLLGASLEEPVDLDNYLGDSVVEFEPLNSGGIFKNGRAPFVEGNHWLSAVILRGDGLSAVTQRLRVLKQKR